jgi:hypothetical protein
VGYNLCSFLGIDGERRLVAVKKMVLAAWPWLGAPKQTLGTYLWES